MPFPNEHSARIANPGKYIRFRRNNDEFGKGIDVIYGITKDGKAEVQSLRFDENKFTAAEAREWLKDHDYKPIEFEAASEEDKEKEDDDERDENEKQDDDEDDEDKQEDDEDEIEDKEDREDLDEEDEKQEDEDEDNEDKQNNDDDDEEDNKQDDDDEDNEDKQDDDDERDEEDKQDDDNIDDEDKQDDDEDDNEDKQDDDEDDNEDNKQNDDDNEDEEDKQEDDNDDENDDGKNKRKKKKKKSSNRIEYKNFPFKVLETKEQVINEIKYGVIKGYASTYGNIDLGGDIVEKGAFNESIDEWKIGDDQIPMCYQHSQMDIIGGFPANEFEDDRKGLLCKGMINLEVQRGKEAYALAKQGVLKSLSIGFLVKEFDFETNRDNEEKGIIRKLKNLQLLEVSMVAMPMNPDAKITEVKKTNYKITTRDIERVNTKANLKRLLRKSKAFTRSAAELLANLIAKDISFEDQDNNNLTKNIKEIVQIIKASNKKHSEEKLKSQIEELLIKFKKN